MRGCSVCDARQRAGVEVVAPKLLPARGIEAEHAEFLLAKHRRGEHAVILHDGRADAIANLRLPRDVFVCRKFLRQVFRGGNAAAIATPKLRPVLGVKCDDDKQRREDGAMHK